jgi:hypothetical protein|tara:strand:+ start:713 stop:2203 length:1491 start_codon:yes stop_codon:yes gene_type:complete
MNAPIEDYETRHFSVLNSEDFLVDHLEWIEGHLNSYRGKSKATDLLIKRGQDLAKRFYQTASTSGSSVLFEVVGYGRSEIVTLDRILAFQRQNWGQVFNFGEGVQIQDLLAFVNTEMYLPLPYTLVKINSAVYFNTYEPPKSVPSGAANLVYNSGLSTARPPLWQEFLDRWFPSNVDVQNVLEAYIAKLIFDPLNRPHFCMVIRSDQGTGKNFLTETILSPLLGDKNVVPTSLDKLVARFNGSLFSNKLIVLNEVDNDRKGTYTKLKDKITDNVITVEDKYKNPRVQSIYSGIFVFSNEEIPLYIDQDDRRFYVTPRLVNKVDKKETQAFIEVFANWLDDVQFSGDGYSAEGYESVSGRVTGMGILASWLKVVADNGYHDVPFRTLPTLGNHNFEMMVEDVSLELESNLLALLSETQSSNLVWQISNIRKDGSPYKLLKEGTVKRLFGEAGFVHRDNVLLKEGVGKAKRLRGYCMSGMGIKALPCTGIGFPNTRFD